MNFFVSVSVQCLFNLFMVCHSGKSFFARFSNQRVVVQFKLQLT